MRHRSVMASTHATRKHKQCTPFQGGLLAKSSVTSSLTPIVPPAGPLTDYIRRETSSNRAVPTTCILASTLCGEQPRRRLWRHARRGPSAESGTNAPTWRWHSPTVGERGRAEERTIGQASAPNPLVSEIISLSPPRYLGSPSEPIRGVRNSLRYHPEPEPSKLSGLSKLRKRAFWGDAASPSHPISRNSRLFPL